MGLTQLGWYEPGPVLRVRPWGPLSPGATGEPAGLVRHRRGGDGRRSALPAGAVGRTGSGVPGERLHKPHSPQVRSTCLPCLPCRARLCHKQGQVQHLARSPSWLRAWRGVALALRNGAQPNTGQVPQAGQRGGPVAPAAGSRRGSRGAGGGLTPGTGGCRAAPCHSLRPGNKRGAAGG